MFATQEILALLVSFEDDMNRVPSDRSVKANYIPRQEIKLGRMPEISIINYECFVRTEETILLIKTMDTRSHGRMFRVDFSPFPGKFRAVGTYLAKSYEAREKRINTFAFDPGER